VLYFAPLCSDCNQLSFIFFLFVRPKKGSLHFCSQQYKFQKSFPYKLKDLAARQDDANLFVSKNIDFHPSSLHQNDRTKTHWSRTHPSENLNKFVRFCNTHNGSSNIHQSKPELQRRVTQIVQIPGN